MSAGAIAVPPAVGNFPYSEGLQALQLAVSPFHLPPDLSANPRTAPNQGMPNCVHGIIGFALSTPPTHIFFYPFLVSA